MLKSKFEIRLVLIADETGTDFYCYTFTTKEKSKYNESDVKTMYRYVKNINL